MPACLLFNESPHLDSVLAAIDLGFNLTMFSDEKMSMPDLMARVKTACAKAHPAGAAVEAEMASLQGMGRQLSELPDDLRLTDPDEARRFVAETGVDALAVNIGQIASSWAAAGPARLRPARPIEQRGAGPLGAARRQFGGAGRSGRGRPCAAFARSTSAAC